MNDIYDIKNILNISPFFKETVYLIILFLIILVFIYLFKKFKKKYINIIETKENLIKNNLNLKNLYLKKLKNLNINDLNYFLKISYIVREFLEKT
jgi:ABC-type multidrug transport system fused ATPase/permease subunit